MGIHERYILQSGMDIRYYSATGLSCAADIQSSIRELDGEEKAMKGEYGKQCQSCQKKVLSRMYYRPCRGSIGKDIRKYRRLCSICWAKMEKKQ